jgi:hypothetical protein
VTGDTQHQFPVSGQRYRVIRPFVDYDRDVHPMGEEWIFLGCQFVPYHGPWSDSLVNRIAERRFTCTGRMPDVRPQDVAS